MNYIFEKKPTISLPFHAKNPVISELLSNYTLGTEWNIDYHQEETVITVGTFKKTELGSEEFVLNVTQNGIYIQGKDYSATMRGLMTLLEKILYDNASDSFYVKEEIITASPIIAFRAVHLCIFPETKYRFLKKCVRSCAIARYTHIILEFWGMLQYDCFKELSWPIAFSKQEVRALVEEANTLGVEIIPMFNHLGHASSCRGISGKHVVLDQNLRLQNLFLANGAVWNFERQEVRNLLRQVREELIEVCGNGSYFHLGCDEAYSLGEDADKAPKVAEYINEIACELTEKGRRTIIWHDMLLSKKDVEGYKANSNQEVSRILLEKLDKNIIVADWEYYTHDEVWKSSERLKKYGFPLLCCPWDNNLQNIDEAIETVHALKLNGIIHTTWHTLYKGFPKMIYAAFKAYGTSEQYSAAMIARKSLPAEGIYENSGWMEYSVGPGL